MSAQVAVLYEDERNTQIRDYPMHRLVCMTIADTLGVDHRDVDAAAKCLGREPPDRKSKLARDQMLASATWAPATVRTTIINALVPLFIPR